MKLASSKPTTVESFEREVLMYLRRQQELEAPSEVSIESLSAGPTSALHVNIPCNSLGLEIVNQSHSQSICPSNYVNDDLSFGFDGIFYRRLPPGKPSFLERHNVESFRLIAQQASNFPFRAPSTSSALSPFYPSP